MISLSLGGDKGKGGGAERVGTSQRKERNREQGKGFGAKTITYWTTGEAAEEGERNQDAGSKPDRGRDADRRLMGSERHSIREREERKERRTHGLCRRPDKQQVDQHRRAGLPHQCGRDARDCAGREIEAGAHRKRRPTLVLPGLARPAARDRHQYGKAKINPSTAPRPQDRITIRKATRPSGSPTRLPSAKRSSSHG